MARHPNRRRRLYPCQWTRRIVLCSLAGLGLLAGCSQDRKDADTQPAPVGELSGVANNIDVVITAGNIAVSDVISSGWTNFIVRNGDAVAHSFGIEGEGVNRILPDPLQPGETQQLRVRLRPGTYRVYVPRGGPNMAGLSRQITVAQW